MTHLPPSRGRERERVDRLAHPTPPPSSRRRALALLAVGALAAAVAFLALRSSPYVQHVAWMPRQLGVWADRNGIFRNVVAFFVLGLTALSVLGPRLLHVVALCAFGTALEVAQLWIPGRVFDRKDIAATLAGILLAWPLAWLVRRLRRRSA